MQEQPPSANPAEQQALYPPNQGQPQPAYPFYQGQPVMPGYPWPPAVAQPTGKIALKYGFIFGAILAACAVLATIVNTIYSRFLPVLQAQYHLSYSALSLYSLVLVGIFMLIHWAIYFLAGIFTARRARRVSTATIACLWAGLCYLIMYVILFSIGQVIIFSTMAKLGSFVDASSFLVIGIRAVITLILDIGLGIGIGALGGLLGRSLASKQAPPMPQMRQAP